MVTFSAAITRINSFLVLTSLLKSMEMCHAALAGISYWHKVFPSTPVPNSIRGLLPVSTALSAIALPPSSYWTMSSSIAPAPGPPYVRYISYWGSNLLSHRAIPSENHNHYSKHLASEVAPNFFLQKSFEPGSNMNLTLMKPSSKLPAFMTLEQAESIPFSSSNFTLILRKLSLKPSSRGAVTVRQALKVCERPPTKEESKCCASTLESMIDCAASILGTSNIHVLATTDANNENKIEPRMYKVGSSGAKLISLRSVACHNLEFPYALFYCHELRNTRSYTVMLEGDDGSRVNAAVVCHFDTSYWDPMHESFQTLGVEPGTAPICHFLQGGFAWVPN